MGKRANGEGWIKKQGDRWVGRISINGTRYMRRGATRKEVVAKINELKAAAASGLEPDSMTLTVHEFMHTWFEEELQGVTPRTAKEYERIANAHIYPSVGKKRLVDLGPVDVKRMTKSLANQGKAPDTVRNVRAVLSRALSAAVENQIVATNVVMATKGVKLERKEKRALTEDEVRVFLDAIKGHRFEALWIVQSFTGLRHGEVLALRWKDLDLTNEKPRLRVENTLYRGQLQQPKTKSSRRNIALAPTVVNALTAHRNGQEDAPPSGLVFRSTTGNYLDSRRVATELSQVTTSAGLGHVNPHMLRHTATTIMIRGGVKVKTISATLGHSSIQMTMNVYGHLFEDDLEAVAEIMEKQIGSGARN